MLKRAAGLLTEVDKRIRALITLAYAVSCDETPLRVGGRTPRPGKKKAEKYLLVAATRVGQQVAHLGYGQRRHHQPRPVLGEESHASHVVVVSLVESGDQGPCVAEDHADATVPGWSRSG
jgi:hypothetical protein